jgi:glutaminyl-peptide cyclotransferase
MKQLAIAFFVTILGLASCGDADRNGSTDETANPPAPLISYTVVNSYPHDTAAFTEGLLFYNGALIESTGSPEDQNHNGTWIGPVDLKTGVADKKINLGRTIFGEGVTILNDKIYQLTYQTHKGFVYDAKTYKKLREFSYAGEGWGLTNDGKNLIMSAGTSNLYYIDPDSLKFISMLGVRDHNGPVPNINELEYIDGYIYANQWLTSYILKIDPATGNVVGRIDLSDLANRIKVTNPTADYLNGIAYDSVTKKIFVTGKKWPKLFEIKI